MCAERTITQNAGYHAPHHAAQQIRGNNLCQAKVRTDRFQLLKLVGESLRRSICAAVSRVTNGMPGNIDSCQQSMAGTSARNYLRTCATNEKKSTKLRTKISATAVASSCSLLPLILFHFARNDSRWGPFAATLVFLRRKSVDLQEVGLCPTATCSGWSTLFQSPVLPRSDLT